MKASSTLPDTKRRLATAAFLSILSSCTVYSPTVPSTPLVQKGQVEISASSRALTTFDGSIGWSPINHLLLNAEAALRLGGGNNTINGVKTPFSDMHRQAGLGVGSYYKLGNATPLYLAAVAGLGAAEVNVHNGAVGRLSEYTANYTRYYGQVYLAQQGRVLSGGLSIRATWLNFNNLLLDGVAVSPIARYYLEPSVFIRAGKSALQSQATFGISLPDRTGPYLNSNNLAANSTLFSLGLVFRPHLLKKRTEVVR